MADINPMSSFEVKNLVEIRPFGIDISITNSSLFMLFAVCIICVLLYICTRNASMIPTKKSIVVENLFSFIGDMAGTSLGPKAMSFFPYILALFLFVFTGNLIGLFPFAFCFTSQIVVTFGLAFIIFFASVVVGIKANGLKYFKRFVPSGVPVAIAPLLAIIEVISFIFRPISMGMRLFANMIAGHMMLDIIASFAVSFICGSIFLKPFALMPILLNTVLTLMKLLVCFIQAYIFTMLTTVYFGEALEHDH